VRCGAPHKRVATTQRAQAGEQKVQVFDQRALSAREEITWTFGRRNGMRSESQRRSAPKPASKKSKLLTNEHLARIQFEIDGFTHPRGNRYTVFLPRFEAPALCGTHGLTVKDTRGLRSDHFDIAHITIGIDRQL